MQREINQRFILKNCVSISNNHFKEEGEGNSNTSLGMEKCVPCQ